MNICIMIDSWLSDFQTGGGHMAVWQLATGLVQKYGCKVDLVVGYQQEVYHDPPKRIEFHLDGQLRIIRVGPCCFPPNSLLGKLIYCVTAIPTVVKGNYDLINAHAFAAGLPGWVSARLTGTPVVYTIQGIGQRSMSAMVNYSLKAKLLTALENLLLFRIRYDHEISVSRDIFEYSNVNQDITIIPNGVNLEEFDAVTCKKASKFQILFVGRFHPQKGLFYLVDAMREVVRVHPEVRVLMVGNGSQLPEVRRRINDYGLDNYFAFTGHLTGVNKIRAFKSSHLFVLPSLYEGQPLTLLEAWAAKLPVIVTHVGANPDFIEQGVNGYIIPPKRADLLAAVIKKAIENPNLATMGINGYQLVKTRYSWDRTVERTYKTYQNVLSSA